MSLGGRDGKIVTAKFSYCIIIGLITYVCDRKHSNGRLNSELVAGSGTAMDQDVLAT